MCFAKMKKRLSAVLATSTESVHAARPFRRAVERPTGSPFVRRHCPARGLVQSGKPNRCRDACRNARTGTPVRWLRFEPAADPGAQISCPAIFSHRFVTWLIGDDCAICRFRSRFHVSYATISPASEMIEDASHRFGIQIIDAWQDHAGYRFLPPAGDSARLLWRRRPDALEAQHFNDANQRIVALGYGEAAGDAPGDLLG